MDEPSATEQDERPTVEASTVRLTSPEAQDLPAPPDRPQREREGWVLYLAVRDEEVGSLSDLSGKAVALGPQDPPHEAAVRQALATAGVAAKFVEDLEADALDRLVRREVAAAPFRLGPRLLEGAGLPDALSQAGVRLLEVPLDVEPLPAPDTMQGRSDG